MSIVRLDKTEVQNATPLFGEIPLGWDVMLNAAKDFGFFLADDRDQPSVALAFIGGCIIYAGDASHGNARALVEAMKVQPLVLPWPEEWAKLLMEVHGDKIKREQRFFLPFSSLSCPNLEDNQHQSCELKKIDLSIAARLEAEMGDVAQLHHYKTLEDFVDRGCGFCILKGDELCSTAMAFMRGGNAIQIQISTKEEYRRQGLATQVGAALLNHCTVNGIRADWDASNPGSRDLAFKLGYTKCIPYTALSLFPE